MLSLADWLTQRADSYDDNASLLADAALLRKLASSPSQPWISVKDRLPIAEERVLFWCARNGGFVGLGAKAVNDPDSSQWFDESHTDRDGDAYDEYDVTHWMPLPAAPALGDPKP